MYPKRFCAIDEYLGIDKGGLAHGDSVVFPMDYPN